MLRGIVIGIALAAGALLAAITILVSTDLGRFRPQLQPLLSQAIGHDVRIDGELSLRMGKSLRLRATEVTVSQDSGPQPPLLLKAEVLSAELDPWSLLSGPFLIRRATLEGTVLRLDKASDGAFNWARPKNGKARKQNTTAGQPRLRVDELSARSVVMLISHPRLTEETRIDLRELRYDATGTDFAATVDGTVNGARFDLEVDAGPLHRLAAARDFLVTATARLGDIEFSGRAAIADLRTFAVTDLDLELAGADAAYLLDLLNLPIITRGALKISAAVDPSPQRAAFKADAQLGEYRLAATGVFADPRKNREFTSEIRLTGPDLAAAAAPLALEGLPKAPFEAEARLLLTAEDAVLDAVDVTVEDAQLRANARLNKGSGEIRIEDIELRKAGTTLTGAIALPSAPSVQSIAFDLQIHQPGRSGLIDEPRRLRLLEAIDVAAFTGHRDGDRWLASQLELKLAENRGSVTGSVEIVTGQAPRFSADLRAERLDVRTGSDDAADPESSESDAHTVLDYPLPFGLLGELEANVHVEIDSLFSALTNGSTAQASGTVQSGVIALHRLAVVGERGKLDVSMEAEPDGEEHRVSLAVFGEEVRLAPPDEEPQVITERPAYTISADLQGRGRTLRDLASTLSGSLRASSQAGRVPRRAHKLSTLFFGDMLSNTLDAINPKSWRHSNVAVECVALRLNFQEGVAQGDPGFAVQTRELNVLARGAIDLRNERLDLDVITRPRRGLGISAGDLLNPFVRVGGTLREPRVVPDPRKGIVAGGSWLATGGALPLFNMLRARFLGGSVCEKVLREDTSGNGRPR